MSEFDLAGSLRRIRRSADLSQRDLARACGISQSVVARAESGERDMPVLLLQRAAALAGLRLVLVYATGDEVSAMVDGAVRDMGGRRFPAHLDTRYSEERWWHGPERYSRAQPWYTFDRDRGRRDANRDAVGAPEDHQLPQPGDSPQERKARRQREARRRVDEEWRRRVAAGEVTPVEQFVCTCPPECDELDEGTRPQHAAGCACDCDVG